ncbi:conserved hypothetical protein [Xenorhabdus bovienii str. kraussei Quebec]|uniref:Uncharacterized protein n=1 Tax=Xenorhabdus bovienii str. kraussei Quebec TaxID=1398203 RepID=A0A077PPQ7_XENBV|nr:hypothetical protein [Xenorhabdus bovienii]CDH21759.1 conserved hypothetical protein [Xenorhabdus bovienii str. kraussei Quebec]
MDEREELMQQISNLLINNPVKSEDKLAVMMMFCFQLLSSTQTDGVNMRVSDGRVLSLKFELETLKH